MIHFREKVFRWNFINLLATFILQRLSVMFVWIADFILFKSIHWILETMSLNHLGLLLFKLHLNKSLARFRFWWEVKLLISSITRELGMKIYFKCINTLKIINLVLFKKLKIIRCQYNLIANSNMNLWSIFQYMRK